MDSVFFIKVGLIALVTWAPIQAIYIAVEYLYPSENKKLQMDFQQ